MKKRLLGLLTALSLIVAAFALPVGMSAAQAATPAYKIYPVPHSVAYGESSFVMRTRARLVADEQVDAPTKARLREALQAQQISLEEGTEADPKALNLLVNVGTDTPATRWLADHSLELGDTLTRPDAYALGIYDGTIAIAASTPDAAFYGATTLYQILSQIPSLEIQQVFIKDYADIVSRGFVEGYYGNPWSWQDRIDLMKWGGYYKLNSYVYAPKDDPKHNSKWRELYTPEELENVKAAAEAGNESKVRFVYALHPFMHRPLRIDGDGYRQDFATLTAKYDQVIEAGVRQIALLADDVHRYSTAQYAKVLTDLTAYLREKQKTYPDLKITLPFCVEDYMGWGHESFKQFPENVQIIMTGGRVWGEVTSNFTNTFTNKVGRGPYMWINWPCTDNSNTHLIMGGAKEFLHVGVDPSKIQGIILNPMEHSEPNKVGLFSGAAYAWNIWDSDQQADEVEAAAAAGAVTHNAVSSPAARALATLNAHMRNHNMDSRIRVVNESVALAPKLQEFLRLVREGSDQGRVDTLAEEIQSAFDEIKQASITFQESTESPKLVQQMLPWLLAAADSADAYNAYLNAWKAYRRGDIAEMAEQFGYGTQALANTRSHYFISKFTERVSAEYGTQHIAPFLRKLDQLLGEKLSDVLDPTVNVRSYITNRTDSPDGNLGHIFDGDPGTEVIYKNPASIAAGTYVGFTWSKPFELHALKFHFGRAGNSEDTFAQMKLQWSPNGTDWQDLEGGKTYNKPGVVRVEGINKTVRGVRALATTTQNNKWFGIRDLSINPPAEAKRAAVLEGTYQLDGLAVRGGSLEQIHDGSTSTFAHLSKGNPNADLIPAGAGVTITFPEVKEVGDVFLAQAMTYANDKLTSGEVQILTPTETWETVSRIDGNKQQTLRVNKPAKAVRIVNRTQVPVWWALSEFVARERDRTPQPVDDNLGGTKVAPYTDVEALTHLTVKKKVGTSWFVAGQQVSLEPAHYVGFKLDAIRQIDAIATPTNTLKAQVSLNSLQWTDVTLPLEQPVDARYVRLLNEGSETVAFNTDPLRVNYLEFAPISVDSNLQKSDSGRDMRGTNKVERLFDGDLSSKAEITGIQTAGKWVKWDLGRERTFNSFRYYLEETNLDFPRHGVFEVSPTGQDGTWKKLLEVGDSSFSNSNNENTVKTYPFFTHDSQNPGYMYVENPNAGGIKGRYLRFRVLTTYDHRWLQFSELQINGGELLSPTSARDFVSTSAEDPTRPVGNMLNNSFTSTWVPAAENGELIYRVSEPGKNNSVRILTTGAASNAEVELTVVAPQTLEEKTVPAGKLAQSINEFVVNADQVITAVKLTWNDTKPQVARIILSRQEVNVDKSQLQAELAAPASTAGKTEKSAQKYLAAVERAKQVLASPAASQAGVNIALASLQSARSALVDVPDLTELTQLANTDLAGGFDAYTRSSYLDYLNAQANAKRALEQANTLTIRDVERLVGALKAARESLEITWKEHQLAQFTLDDLEERAESLPAENYTADSWKALSEKQAALRELVSSDTKDSRVEPATLRAAREALTQALGALVGTGELKIQLEVAEAVTGAPYTLASFQALETKIAEAKQLLKNGTSEQLEQSRTALASAIAQLEKEPVTEGTVGDRARLGALPAGAEDEKLTVQVTPQGASTPLTLQLTRKELAEKGIPLAKSGLPAGLANVRVEDATGRALKEQGVRVHALTEVESTATHENTPLLTEGQPLKVKAYGYQPGENVEVYLHSEPLLLGTAQADDHGVVSFTGELPSIASSDLEQHAIVVSSANKGEDGQPMTTSRLQVTLKKAERPESEKVNPDDNAGTQETGEKTAPEEKTPVTPPSSDNNTPGDEPQGAEKPAEQAAPSGEATPTPEETTPSESAEDETKPAGGENAGTREDEVNPAPTAEKEPQAPGTESTEKPATPEKQPSPEENPRQDETDKTNQSGGSGPEEKQDQPAQSDPVGPLVNAETQTEPQTGDGSDGKTSDAQTQTEPQGESGNGDSLSSAPKSEGPKSETSQVPSVEKQTLSDTGSLALWALGAFAGLALAGAALVASRRFNR